MSVLQKMSKFALVNTLTPHIQYLIVNNDCVVIPGWGALVASVGHSRLENGQLTPPCRSLGFNQSLNHTDGMLASSIARRDGVSYQVADSIVREGVDEMRNIYDVNGEVSIDRIGTFSRDANGSMLFSPAADGMANAKYFGLPALALPAEENEVEPEHSVRFVHLRRAVRVAASVAILTLLGFVLSTPVLIDRQHHDFASLAYPEIKPGKPVDLPQPETSAPQQQPAPKLYISMPPADAVSSEIPTQQPQVKTRNKSYYLIVASHATRRQAEDYIAARGDEQLDILERDGRFRVYAATGATLEEARKPMADKAFASLHPDGWVYRAR